MESLLQIEGLGINYLTRTGTVRAVEDVSFSIRPRETIGLVGESGCGKSTIGLSILGILPRNGKSVGRILYKERNIAGMALGNLREIRGKEISMIFQDPMTSLDSIMRIRKQFYEMVRAHHPHMKESEMLALSSDALRSVGIDPSRLNNYPFEFSGGMRQRVMIALAIALGPSLLIADEPTTSLDVVVQAQIMGVLKELKDKKNMSMILITHDLGVVAEIVDRIVVMYAGHLVEYGGVFPTYEKPLHPYTRLLLKSIPNVKLEDRELRYIKGTLPNPKDLPEGCRFAPRCPFVMKVCSDKKPPLFEIGDRRVKCWLYGGEEDGTKDETADTFIG